MTYLYSDGENWHFMDQESFDQISINEDIMSDAKQWLIGQEACEVISWNGSPISIEVPPFVELKITSSEPGVKGDTVSGATKPATLETGVSIQVPLFVEEGETIKVDTGTSEYAGRK